MTKLKKVVAGILAAAAMATSVVGMSASAYSPTVSRTVGSVTGTLYSDTTYGYGTTACSNQTCYVKVKHGGTTSGWANSYGYAKIGRASCSCKNSATNGTTNAQSWHRTASTSSFSLYF